MRHLIYTLSFLALAYPALVWYLRADLVFDETLALNLFPAFGLLAFTIMWLHVVGGALRSWLEKHIDFGKFVSKSSVAVLVLIILHPLFLFLGVGVRNTKLIF